MTRDDIIAIENYRRFLRPDWRRWLPGDPERGLTGEQIKAQRHDFMLRDRAFETPLARRLRKEQEEREQIERERLEAEQQAEIEQAVLEMKAELAELRFELTCEELRWKAECAERKRKADLAWERFIAAFKRGDFRHKANFNPDQPRDELGRWTDEGGASDAPSGEADDQSLGAGNDEPRILLDAPVDSLFKPGAQLAQDDTARRSPVDLLEEEARGGHTISTHVNRSPEALKAQVQEAFDRDPEAHNVHSGSFSSVEAANKLVNSTLAQNRAIIDQVATGLRAREVVFAEFGSITGVEAVGPNIRSEVYFRQTYNVGVVVQHDTYSLRGYSVLTAFPTNRRQP